MNRYLVYKHIRLDNNNVFYIGIGNEKRPFSKKDRNNHWKNITNKYKYCIEIITICDTWEEACDVEKYLIKYYGRKDLGLGTLVNMTDGGEGVNGLKHSDVTKNKMKNRIVWNKDRNLSKEHKLKLKLNSGKSKKIICTKTSCIWNSIVDCAIENNINSITLSQYLRGVRKNKTTFKFLEDVK